MKKQDLLIIAVLFALLMAWPFLYKRWIAPEETGPAKTLPTAGQAETTRFPVPALSPTTSVTAAQVIPAEPIPPVQPQEKKPAARTPEQRLTLANTGVSLEISTQGGGIVSATFADYRQTVEKDSGPLALDFAGRPALTYQNLPGFSADDDFRVVSNSPAAVVLESKTADGLRLTRTIELNSQYQAVVRDLFVNTAAADRLIPKHAVQAGAMQAPPHEYRMSGMNYLGIDALAASGGEGVIHWAGKLAKLFKTFKKEKEMSFLPKTIEQEEEMPVDWIAVKNKFFTQILVPEGGAAGYRLAAERIVIEGEDLNPALKPKNAEIQNVSAAAVISAKTLNGGETLCRTFKLYVGPKKYSILRTLGLHQEEVMEFGMWSPVCRFLLTVLNKTYNVIPNYGAAIILLTILIRIIFWPLTHKSTESMKKMQALQPLMTEIKAKHKDNPKKLQEETMALYRKHKVNPVSGCLPMLIQIPVFIALFVVLRSAVELRFASFLWVTDLSAPERLFADVLPIPLNILPIFMAVSQAWQQSLMPATDPNQQKMMLFFMPAVMLVMFYMMPSALVLYWSANQCIVIVQQLIQKKRTARAAAAKK
ncbi:MAG: membrane protein insertase YidC [Kiritimatiellae bacterium]|nr:membrane protein insertase YidC [Kiritimatiellia bacterium]